MSITHSGFKLFTARLTIVGIGFLGIVYFSRELGAAQMGIFFLFQAILGILAIPADFGLRGAVEKRISEGESQEAYLSSAITVKVIPILTITTVIIVLKPYINTYLGADVAILLVLAIILREIALLFVFVLKGELRVGETAVPRLAQQVTWVGVGFIFVSLGMRAVGLIYGLLAGLLVMLIWSWSRASVSLSKPSIEHAQSLFNYSKYNVITSVGGSIYNWADLLIIGFFLSQSHVGAYETAWRVTMVVALLSKSISEALLPQVSQWTTEEATAKIESAVRETVIPSMILVLPSFFGTLIFSREILGLVFGEGFAIAWFVLIILMGEKIFQSILTIHSSILMGLDRPDMAAYATIFSVIINIVLNIVFVIQFGIIGAAVATTLSVALNTILHGYFLSTLISVSFPFSEIGWCVLSSMVMALSLYILQTFIQITTLFQLFFAIGLGVVIYGLLILLYNPIRSKLTKSMPLLLP